MEEVPQLLSSRRIFEGRVFNVRIDDLRYGDGSEHRVDVVEHGASLAIVATPSSGRLILVRQYRHPAGVPLWEIPAGTAEPGETLLEGARRELREETGYRATDRCDLDDAGLLLGGYAFFSCGRARRGRTRLRR